MNIGDKALIVEDEYPQLVGLTGTVYEFSSDGTTAWSGFARGRGVWCSVSNLEAVS